VKSVLIVRNTEDCGPLFKALQQESIPWKQISLVTYESVNYSLTLDDLSFYDGIFLASRRALEFLLKAVPALPLWSDKVSFYCVGKSTANALKEQGFLVKAVAEDFHHFCKICSGVSLLYPCSEALRDEDVVEAEQVNISLYRQVLYRPVPSRESAKLSDVVEDCDVILVFSSSQAQALSRCSSSFEKQVLCLGERTARRLKELGYTHVLKSPRPDLQSMLAILIPMNHSSL
jgi:uroporphyrinogen-III synthase